MERRTGTRILVSHSPSTPLRDLHDGERDTSLAKGDARTNMLAVPQQGRDRDIDAQLFTFIKSDYLGQGEHDHVQTRTSSPRKSTTTIAAACAERSHRGSRSLLHKVAERTYELIANSLQLKVVGDNIFDATFRYNFQVSNGARRLSGMGLTFLTIQLRNGRFEITKETGSVVKRN